MGRKGKYKPNPSLYVPSWWRVFVAYAIDLSLFPLACIAMPTPLFFVVVWFFTAFLIARCEGKEHPKDTAFSEPIIESRLGLLRILGVKVKAYDPANVTLASLGKRLVGLRTTPAYAEKLFFAYLLDLFPIVIIDILYGMSILSASLRTILVILLPLLYFTLTESRTGQSFGKKLLGVHVYQIKDKATNFRKKEENVATIKNPRTPLLVYVLTLYGVLYILTFVIKWTDRFFDKCTGVLPDVVETIVFPSIILLEIVVAIIIWLAWSRKLRSK